MSEWQPGASAPKDGTLFLAFDASVPCITIVYWDEEAADGHSDGWASFWCSGTDEQLTPEEVTHWMPLPAHPSGDTP